VSAHPSAGRIVAEEARIATLPIGARCQDCETEDLTVLVPSSAPVRCYRDLAAAEGRPTMELHHVGGVPSPITVLVDANLHRRLSLLQALTWRALGAKAASPEAILIDLLALRALVGEKA
jgi:hypothetical protein